MTPGAELEFDSIRASSFTWAVRLGVIVVDKDAGGSGGVVAEKAGGEGPEPEVDGGGAEELLDVGVGAEVLVVDPLVLTFPPAPVVDDAVGAFIVGGLSLRLWMRAMKKGRCRRFQSARQEQREECASWFRRLTRNEFVEFVEQIR